MKVIRIFSVFLLVLAMNASAAVVQGDVTVGTFGLEGSGRQVYVGITPNPNGCVNGGVYFLLLGNGGQFRSSVSLSQVLGLAAVAKATDKRVRLDYSVSADHLCYGEQIYIQ